MAETQCEANLMHVELTDPELTRDLLRFLRRLECVAVQTGETALEAYPRIPMRPEDARRELGRLLLDWQSSRNGAAAYLVD